MPDPSDEQCITAEPNPSSPTRNSNDFYDFHYPQLCLQASFDSLLSHSYPSSHNTAIKMSSWDRPPSNLGESWTSLDDAEYDDDLQSENTDVGSLVDAHSTEDVHSVADDTFSETDPPDNDEESEDEGQEGVRSDHNVTRNQDFTFQQLTGKEPPDFTTTPQSKEEADEESTDHEYSFTTSSSTDDLNHIIQSNERHRISLVHVGSAYVPVSNVRAKISKEKPFQVFLLFEKPEMDRWKHEIISKIGAALVASGQPSNEKTSSTSRYHIVPSEFGPGSNPDYAELIPVEAQIAVQSCVFSSRSLPNDQFNLHLEGERISVDISSSWPKLDNSPRFFQQCQWGSHDLDILCIADEEDSAAQRSRDLMHAFLKQNTKPCIIIRIHSSRPRDLLTYPPRRLIQQHSTNPSGSPENSRTPLGIHIAEFLDLDADLLNRHIAYLINSIAANRIVLSKEHRQQPNILHTEMAKSKTRISEFGYGSSPIVASSNWGYISRHLLFAFIILFAATLGLDSCKAWYNYSNRGIDVTTYSNGQKVLPSSSATSKIVDSTSAHLNTHMLSTRVPALHFESDHESSQFQLEIVGECHLIVRTPKTSRSKKKNGLVVQVARDQTKLPIVVQELFDNVYSVKLNPDDSFGKIQVNLTTRKPPRTEMILVDLGNEPKQQVMWRDAIQRADDQISEMLEKLSNSVKQFETSKTKDDVLSDLRSRLIGLAENVLRPVKILRRSPVTKEAIDKLRWLQWNIGNFIYSEAGVMKQTAIDIARSDRFSVKNIMQQSSKYLEESIEYFRRLQESQKLQGDWHLFGEKIGIETMAKVQQRARYLAQQILTKLRH